MAQLNFHQVTSLPATLQANAFYFVLNGTFAESYLTNQAGEATAMGNSAMINKLIQDALTAAASSGNEVEIVADIAARNAMTAQVDRNVLVLVIDATGDTTVKSGSALYAYRNSDDSTFKVAEYESMDAVVRWADITGGPSSTPEAIDLAVTRSHTHANKAVLDKLNDDGNGGLTYNGSAVSSQWAETAW